MNYNILSYIVFFTISAFVTVWVGWIFYSNGRHFIVNLIQNDPHLVDSINKLLLVGYYLLNLGYVAIIISTWTKIESITEFISTTAVRTGFIITGLGILHFFNMSAIHIYSNKRRSQKKKILSQSIT